MQSMPKKIYRLLSTRFKISLLLVGYLMVLYTLLRFGFFISNLNFFKQANMGDIVLAFIYGLRFDLSAIFMLNAFLLLIYNLPLNYDKWKWLKIIFFVIWCLTNIIFIIINLSDYRYFTITQHRLTVEIYLMFGYIILMLPEMWADYWYLFLGALLGTTIFVFISWYLLHKLKRFFDGPFLLRNQIISFFFIAVLIMPVINGRFSREPIRPAHAFFSNNQAVGYLTLNSSFTVLNSLFRDMFQFRFMPQSNAFESMNKMLYQSNEKAINPEYPFLRYKNLTAPSRKLNVVLFIMESWTADYISSITGVQPSVTPFFDQISSEGMLFTNFLANGHRTIMTIPSTLASVPGFFSPSRIGKKDSIIRSQSDTIYFLGLGNILSKEGYTTSFHLGGYCADLRLDIYTKILGFDHYYSNENCFNQVLSNNRLADEELFIDTANRFDVLSEPFCSVILSETSHVPYVLPPHREEMFNIYSNETKYQKALRYTDYSLKMFFQSAQNKQWFKNTIFLITADHTAHPNPNDIYSCYHIPLLIYSPTLVKPGRIETIGSHVDILPTILDMLQLPVTHSSMGISLFASLPNRYAIITNNVHYFIFNNRFVLVNDLERTIGLYEYSLDRLLKNDLRTRYPEITSQLEQNLFAYLQSVSYAIRSDKICRPDDLK